MLKRVLEHIIVPVLTELETYDPGINSPGARWLLLGTGLAESRYRTRVQGGGGPARSFWQIEKPTYDDVISRYKGVTGLRAFGTFWEEVSYNDWYACAVARAVYRYRPGAVPAPTDAAAMGRHWKQYYNTPAGAGTAEKFSKLYADQVMPLL